MHHPDPSDLLDSVLQETREVVKRYHEVVVAFSGGVDSTLVLALLGQVLPKERLTASTVDWGPYFPGRIRAEIARYVREHQVRHLFLPGQAAIEEVAKSGPSCNRCTRTAKLGTLRRYYGSDTLIVGGSNRSDSWGHRGLKIHRNTYSPLLDLEKTQVHRLVETLGLVVRRAGEHPVREGCYLKHLLKPLASDLHGRVTVESNVRLFEALRQAGWNTDLANVTVIGPLQKNRCLVNLLPAPPREVARAILDLIGGVEGVDDAVLIDRPVTLTVRANPGQYHNATSLYWLHKGRIQPQFAHPVRIRWLSSTNRKLRTFQVVDCIL